MIKINHNLLIVALLSISSLSNAYYNPKPNGQQPDLLLAAAENSGLQLKASDTLKIGIVADVHIRDGNRAQLADWGTVIIWLEAFLNNMEQWKADFNIELGDFNDGHNINPEKGDGHEDRLIKGKAVWETSMSNWRSHKVPFYYVMGNHEVQNGRDNKVIAELKGMQGNYYSFEKKGVHFIVLDTNYEGLKSPQAFIIPEEQVEWLKKELASTDKTTIVFLHCPIDTYFGIGGTRPDTQKLYNTVENEEQIRKILEEDGDVILVLEGHSHNGLGPIPNEPKESITNGIRYWFLPSFNASASCYGKLMITDNSCSIEIINNPEAINGNNERGDVFKMQNYSFTYKK
jgi:hypothetical protein